MNESKRHHFFYATDRMKLWVAITLWSIAGLAAFTILGSIWTSSPTPFPENPTKLQLIGYYLKRPIAIWFVRAEAGSFEMVKTALTAVGGIGAIAYLVIRYRERTDQETELYNKAIENEIQREKDQAETADRRLNEAVQQLGSKSPQVRIAGVYALADVSDTYKEQYKQRVVNILCGYLRTDRSKQQDAAVESTILQVMREHLLQGTNYKDEYIQVKNDDQLWTEYEIDLHGAIISEELNFTDCKINAANFNSVHFNKNVVFNQAFFKRIDFSGASFGGKASFFNAIFESKADFSDTTFESAADFGTLFGESKTVFKGEAVFENATFESKADFSHATFENAANFGELFGESRTVFKGEAVFENATFESKADFSDTTFESAAYFANVTFESRSDFSLATFESATYFANLIGESTTVFKGEASFEHVTFKNATYFGKPYGNSKIVFKGEANFSHATFESVAYFHDTKFKGAAYFGNTVFESKSCLDSATFNLIAEFQETVFSGDPSFKDTNFIEEPKFIKVRTTDTNMLDDASFNADDDESIKRTMKESLILIHPAESEEK